MYTNDQLVALLMQRLPRSDQIEWLDATTETCAVRIRWRGFDLRISDNLLVEQVHAGMLRGTEIAWLLSELLKRQP